MEYRIAAWLKVSLIVLLSIFAIAAKAQSVSSDTVKNNCDMAIVVDTEQ